MKLHLATADGQHLITGYDEKSIAINHQKYTKSLVVTPEAVIDDWLDESAEEHAFSMLTNTNFSKIVTLKPELVLLGTGRKHQFLHPKHYDALTQIGVAVECMNTAAACRTYNILMSEGRFVAAALLIE